MNCVPQVSPKFHIEGSVKKISAIHPAPTWWQSLRLWTHVDKSTTIQYLNPAKSQNNTCCNQGRGQNIMFGRGLEPRVWWAREREPITGVWGRNLVRRSGSSPAEAKSSLAFDTPAAEQNVPDSGYVAVHTGRPIYHKAFCNQVSDWNANRQKFSVVTHMWRSYVRRVWGG